MTEAFLLTNLIVVECGKLIGKTYVVHFVFVTGLEDLTDGLAQDNGPQFCGSPPLSHFGKPVDIGLEIGRPYPDLYCAEASPGVVLRLIEQFNKGVSRDRSQCW